MKNTLLHTELKKETMISGYPKEYEVVVMKIMEITKDLTQRPDYKPSEEFLEQERKKVDWEMSWHKSGILSLSRRLDYGT